MSGGNPGTLLSRFDKMITGFGFKREIQGLDINSLRLETGAILVADSGNPGRVSLETNFEGVQLPSSQTDLGTLTFKIPRDYDETLDYLRVRFLANSAGDTDTPSIDATMYRKRAAAALSADLDPTISAVVNTNTAIAAWVEIVADSQGMKPGDGVSFDISTGGTRGTSDALNIYAIEVIYKSDLVYFDPDDRN